MRLRLHRDRRLHICVGLRKPAYERFGDCPGIEGNLGTIVGEWMIWGSEGNSGTTSTASAPFKEEGVLTVGSGSATLNLRALRDIASIAFWLWILIISLRNPLLMEGMRV
ncbi:hypothetical protein HAX54_035121 [Datura stramonium]|uniref:Uncharacterized protein n=1 Tax=Datura stramonium TaxID=4076 RepID=A0ABS8VIN0_DATST|nr:hypothetical protein [Datura stramonium]